MTKEDIYNLAKKAPYTKIIVSHMESWNHCRLSREELKAYVSKKKLSEYVYIPDNGENMSFGL